MMYIECDSQYNLNFLGRHDQLCYNKYHVKWWHGWVWYSTITFCKYQKTCDLCIKSFFVFFCESLNPKKIHNMVCLILDTWCKHLHIVSSFINKENDICVVNEYDKNLLYSMLLKSYEHTPLCFKCSMWFPNCSSRNNTKTFLDIFKMASCTNELAMCELGIIFI